MPFDNPFTAPGRWWRGNLHLHTNRSDGPLSPEDSVLWYHRLGYDFLSITDHGLVVEPPEAPPGMLLIPAGEFHTVTTDPPQHWHFVSIAPSGVIKGLMGPVHALYASVRENSAFHFLAHPHWSNLAEDDLLRFDDLPAVEAYNGVCERAIARGFSEPAWDFALSTGRRLLGMAVDDSHVDSDFGRGWIMLKAEVLDRDAVIDSLRRGLYYSTCGPQIRDFRVEGTTVSVRCSPCWCVKFITNGFNGENVFHDTSELVESAAHELTGSETYLRVQVEDVHGRRAYTNPVYFT